MRINRKLLIILCSLLCTVLYSQNLGERVYKEGIRQF